MSNPNDRQVAGTHYKGEWQHWDWTAWNGIGYLEGSLSAYICRYKRKGTPLQDLEKALHYAQKIEQLYLQHSYVNPTSRHWQGTHRTNEILKLYKLEGNEAFVIIFCREWRTIQHIELVQEAIMNLISKVKELSNG